MHPVWNWDRRMARCAAANSGGSADWRCASGRRRLSNSRALSIAFVIGLPIQLTLSRPNQTSYGWKAVVQSFARLQFRGADFPRIGDLPDVAHHAAAVAAVVRFKHQDGQALQDGFHGRKI